jgi:hypothetical protein
VTDGPSHFRTALHVPTDNAADNAAQTMQLHYRTEGSAPKLRSTRTHFACPWLAASCSAVFPSAQACPTSAIFCSHDHHIMHVR